MNPLDTVNRWNDAWNAGDPDAVADCYTEDVVYEHPMLPEPLKGKDALRQFIAGIHAAFSEVDDSVAHAVVSGDEVAAEIRHKARHTGEMVTPMGALPATNKVADLMAAHFFRVNGDGLIVEERMYTNPMVMMAQLGVMPPTG